MNTIEIERALRQAPRPQPAAHLKEALCAAATPPRNDSMVVERTGFRNRSADWLKRWWPALAPAAVSLACAALFTAQQNEIRKLERAAAQQPRAAVAEPADAAADAGSAAQVATHQGVLDEETEIARLRSEAARLTAQVSALERMKGDNQKLKEQIAARASSAFTPEEIANLEAAREKALAIQCINNLKQLGLASRIWANDHGEVNPPRVMDMTNEMGSPKILVCPADTGRQAAADWNSYTTANCSYEFLAPSSTTAEPNRVLFRCPVHGTVGLVDGSVQAIGKTHPERLFQKDGNIYMRSDSEMSVQPSH